MNPLTALMDAVLGRRRRLEELRQSRAELVAEYERHLAEGAEGSEAAAEKTWAKVERLDVDIRAAEAALRLTQDREAAKQRAAEAAEQRRREQERDEAEELPLRLAEELEKDALAFAAKWRALFDAHEAYHEKAVVAGTPAMQPGGLNPNSVLNIVFFGLTSALQRPDRGIVKLPDVGSRSRTIESIASRHARYRSERAEAQVSHPLAKKEAQ